MSVKYSLPLNLNTSHFLSLPYLEPPRLLTRGSGFYLTPILPLLKRSRDAPVGKAFQKNNEKILLNP